MYNIILEFKIQNLKNGLMESSLNKLELYIREICKPYDLENKGYIHCDNLMLALKNCKKIVLS